MFRLPLLLHFVLCFLHFFVFFCFFAFFLLLDLLFFLGCFFVLHFSHFFTNKLIFKFIGFCLSGEHKSSSFFQSGVKLPQAVLAASSAK